MILNPESEVSIERGINVMQAMRFSKMTWRHHPGLPGEGPAKTYHCPCYLSRSNQITIKNDHPHTPIYKNCHGTSNEGSADTDPLV